MPKVEVCFHTVNGYVALTVLIRIESARIDIDIRVKLLNGDVVASGLQKLADRRRDDSFTKRRNHTASDEDILSFCHDVIFFWF